LHRRLWQSSCRVAGPRIRLHCLMHAGNSSAAHILVYLLVVISIPLLLLHLLLFRNRQSTSSRHSINVMCSVMPSTLR
jgi:hypothetical protein